MLNSLVQAIPRRGLASWPSTQIQVISRFRQVVTVASENHLLFSWPVPGVQDLRDGIGQFMSRWPSPPPAPAPHSTRSVTVDDQGRLVLASNAARARALETASIDSLYDAVVEQVMGSMLMLFAARLAATTIWHQKKVWHKC